MAMQVIKSVAKELGAKKVLNAARSVPSFVKRSWADAMFELDWKVLANPKATRLFEGSKPELSNAQRRVVIDLQNIGVATIHITDLFGAEGARLWEDFKKVAHSFIDKESTQKEIEKFKSGQNTSWKDYVIRMHPTGTEINLEHFMLQMPLRPELLDTVNSYLGLWSKMIGADLWYTIPINSGRGRTASQNWHRDPEDRKLVKVFLYLFDVGPDAGPLEYIPESRIGRKYDYLWPETTGGGGYGYPPQEEIEKAVPASDRIACTVPAGTFVFCDTSGFHRGGYSTGKERVLGNWIYVTPASRYTSFFKLDGNERVSSLRPNARYALS